MNIIKIFGIIVVFLSSTLDWFILEILFTHFIYNTETLLSVNIFVQALCKILLLTFKMLTIIYYITHMFSYFDVIDIVLLFLPYFYTISLGMLRRLYPKSVK